MDFSRRINGVSVSEDELSEPDRISVRIEEEASRGAWTKSMNSKKEEIKNISDIRTSLSTQEKRSAPLRCPPVRWVLRLARGLRTPCAGIGRAACWRRFVF